MDSKEKIARTIYEQNWPYGWDSVTKEVREPYLVIADQIISILKEDGWVQLDDDPIAKPQELLNQESKKDWFRAYGITDVLIAWQECYRCMIKAGYRKVRVK